MAITAHVYQIHIKAEPDVVWRALTDPAYTRRYFHGTAFAAPPVAGEGYRTVLPDGSGAVDGTIEELTPPSGDRPGRFVQTWHVLYDAALAEEPPSRVEWTVERAGEGLTRVRLVHGDLAGSPLTWANVKDGWVWVLDALKTLLETDRELPPVDRDAAPADVRSPDWHRAQGVEANNSAFELLSSARGADDDEELLRRAYAAAYHWERSDSARPENEARAAYLVARALVATGQPERGLVSAERCLARCTAHGLADFDLAYAHEARTRALLALGRDDDAKAAWVAATAVPVADPEDRAILDRDFADLRERLG